MTLPPAIIDEFERLTREVLTHTGPRGILAGLVGELVDILEQAANFHIAQQPGVTAGETAAGDGLAISPPRPPCAPPNHSAPPSSSAVSTKPSPKPYQNNQPPKSSTPAPALSPLSPRP